MKISVLEGFLASLVAYYIIIYLVVLAVGVLAYIYNAYILMKIGRRLNGGSDWMPYVPFCKEYYMVKMIDEPTWKMFFMGNYCGLMLLLLLLFVGLLMQAPVFFMVLMTVYLIACLVVIISYYNHYYKKLGLHPILTITRIATAFYFVHIVLDTLYAMGHNYQVSQEMPVNLSSPSGASAAIQGVTGYYKDSNFAVKDGESFMFGRDPKSCNIIFASDVPNISREHCLVKFDAAQNAYIVTDYSTFGTIVNGTKLTSHVPTVAAKGSTLDIATSSNRFKLD